METHGISLLIDYSQLLENKISLESWFILYCLNSNRRDLLQDYVLSCGTIKTPNYIKLQENGFLTLLKDPKESFTTNDIRITEKGLSLFKGKLDNNKEFEELFDQLKKTYPSKVPTENGGFRRLHGDLARCRKLYKKILYPEGDLDINLHKSILRAINIQVDEYTRGKRLPYIQNLVTYLHQGSYLQYLGVDEKEVEIKDFKDDI